MKIIISKPHLQVISLGILAGMRSMAAPAVTSRILRRHRTQALRHSSLSFMQSATTANVLSVLALGEFIGDKLPLAPNRIALPALICRCLSGAVVGAGIYKSSRDNLYAGALLGGITAFAATFASFYIRKEIAGHARLIDPIIGSIEDVIVLGGALALTETA